jgi:hypothetical protein
MALWFPIMVNQHEVGRVELVRISPVDHTPDQDEDCTYALRYYKANDFKLSFEGTVKHPYKATNPIPLLSAALTKIEGEG